LYWKGVKYNYTVTRTSVEDPNDSDIESPTTDNILTIYTCYPLWTTDYRFAIQAKLNK
jgi:sortase (surface protein transpeptidase)